MAESRDNPFPGLRPFEQNEDYLFFGREVQTRELLRRLRLTRFLAVVGTSGSGKSSLVKAGLLPALHGGMMSGSAANWRMAVMRPGGDPIAALAEALVSPRVLGKEWDEQEAAIQTSILRTTLRRGSRGLVDAVAQRRLPPGDRLLLVVDQFEELFRFRADGATEVDVDATAFVRLLLAASRTDDATGDGTNGPEIYIVITMRSDFLGDCAQFRDLPESINDGQYLIPRLTREERRKAITGPAAVGGARIASRLVRRLLNDVGDNPDQLPILQHALMRTWDHAIGTNNADTLDLPDYDDVGGMASALSIHADKVYRSLPDEHARALAEKLFKAITEKGLDNRSRRRPCRLADLCRATAATPEELCKIIEAFRQPGRTFLMPPHGTAIDEHAVIDISHESLMRIWARLKKWVDQEAESARGYRRLLEAAREHNKGKGDLWPKTNLAQGLKWEQENEPVSGWAGRYGNDGDFELAMRFLRDSETRQREQEREEEQRRGQKLRFHRRVTGAVVAIMVAIAGLAGYAFVQKNQADARYAQAEASLLWSNLVFRDRQISPIEKETLWRLIASGRKVKDVFVAQLLERETLSQRYARAARPLTRALVGLDTDYRQRLIDTYLRPRDNPGKFTRTTLGAGLLTAELEATEGIDALLEAIMGTTVDVQLTVLGEGLQRIAGQLAEPQTATLAKDLLQAIVGPNEGRQISWLGKGLNVAAGRLTGPEAARLANRLIPAIQGTKDHQKLSALGGGLKVAVDQLTDTQPALLAGLLVQAIRDSENSTQLSVLGDGLEVVASKLTDTQPVALIEELVEAILGAENEYQLSALDEGLKAAVGKPSSIQAAAIVDVLVLAIPWSTNSNQLSALGEGLKLAAAGGLADPKATELAKGLVEAIQAAEYPSQIAAFYGGLAALPGRPTDAQAATIAAALIPAMVVVNYYGPLRAGLAEGFEQGVGKLTPAQAAPLATILVQAIRCIEDYSQLSGLGSALEVVAKRLTGLQAGTLVEALGQPTTSGQRSELNRGLAALRGELTDAQAIAVTATLVKAILKSKPDGLPRELGESLELVAGKLTDTQAIAVTENLVRDIRSTKDSEKLDVLYRGLAALPGELTDTQASLAGALVTEILNTTPYDYIQGYGVADKQTARLKVVAGKLTTSQAAFFADQLVEDMWDNRNERQLAVLGEGLEVTAGRLDDTKAVLFAGAQVQRVIRIRVTTDPYKFLAASQSLIPAMGKLIASHQATPIVKPLIQAILDVTDPYQRDYLSAILTQLSDKQAPLADALIQVIQEIEDDQQPAWLYQRLANLPGPFSDIQATAATVVFVQAIRATKDDSQRAELGWSLKTIADKLTDTQAPRAAEVIGRAVLETADLETAEYGRLAALSQGLAALPGQLPDHQVTAVSVALFRAIQGTEAEDHNQLAALAQGLVALPGRLTAPQATEVAATLVEAIVGAENGWGSFSALEEGLKLTVGKLTKPQAAALAKDLVEAIVGAENRWSSSLSALEEGLKLTVGKLTKPQALALAKDLVKAVLGTSESSQLSALEEGLKLAVHKLTKPQAAAFAETLVQAMRKTTDEGQFSTLATGAGGLLTDSQARSLVEVWLRAVQGAVDVNQISALSRRLAALPDQLTDSEKTLLVDALLQATQHAPDNRDLRQDLKVALEQLGSTESDNIAFLLEALKAPTIEENLEAMLLTSLRKQLAADGSAEPDIWTLVRMARLRYPGIDLSGRSYLAAMVVHAKGLATKGKIDQALSILAEAQGLAPRLKIYAGEWNTLCWNGSLWGQAAAVLHACRKAVEMAPGNGGILDSRGLARALTGNRKGAIADFKAYRAWGEKKGKSQESLNLRRDWIVALEKGDDPFPPTVLQELRN